MAHAIPSRAYPHPDPGRIAGMSIAIALNAAFLLLLLRPMEIPPAIDLPTLTKHIQAMDIPVVEVQPVTLPTPPPQPQQPNTPTQHVTRPQVPTQPPVVVDQGNEMAPITPTTPTIATPTSSIEPASPPTGIRLEYLQAPAPAYPRAALRARSEGTVMLQVLVDIDGRPLRVEIQDSSGDRRLDAAAREQVLRHWRFRPAMRDGRVIQAIGLVPVAFTLNR